VLNSAGALIVGGKADNFKDGIALAGELIDRGLAAQKLDALCELSNTVEKTA
jgi:anthranilate phosphoribosyltransferase